MIYSHFLKRLFDVSFALVLFIILSWLFMGMLLMYVLLFQFPVFFRQKRIGKDNEPFTMIKFRTLQGEGGQSPESRRFWWGDVLRFFSLDELPQLWNVLTGEMSFIGPRPLPIDYLPLMNEQQRQRHRVRPGITGWTQVNGRTNISWEKKFELDAYYVRHVSFVLDMKIFFRTIALLFSFAKDNSLKEKKFEG